MNNEELQSLQGVKVLVGVAGSIAATKTPMLVSNLIKAGAEVRCVVTKSASMLVSPIALSTLSRNRCFQDEDQWDPKESKPLHISLSEWAEIIVIAPLSATSLSKWVNGSAEGLLASILLASEKPIIAAAAMNTGMWQNSSVIKNWKSLDDYPKVLKLNPSSGILACDRIGEGRMASVEIIQLAIKSALITKNANLLIKKDLLGKNVLITAGATIEYLDPARQISNRSSGRMGISIAQAARFRGAKVDLIHGALNIQEPLLEGLNTFNVSNADQMQVSLRERQVSADLIVMTAAVSDLRKKRGASKNKLSKAELIASLPEELEIVPDLLKEVTSRKETNQLILGFAALTGQDEHIKALGEEKRVNKGCDLLMANPIDRPNEGFGENNNGGYLLGPNKMSIKLEVQSKFELANKLIDHLLAFKSKNS